MYATTVIPVYALEQEKWRDEVRRANVILGRNPLTDEQTVFFGSRRLARVAAGSREEDVQAITLALDFSPESSELEYAAATVLALKGHVEHNGEVIGEPPGEVDWFPWPTE